MEQPKAIVLGGTFPHIELIKKLKQRGYYVILVDYLLDPIAKRFADEHIRESTLDCDAVLTIAQEQKVKAVVSCCVDQANVTSSYVCEKLGLPAPYDYSTALSVTDKQLMKSIMVENNISTAAYYTVSDVSEFRAGLIDFPIIIKPADSNSSKGVKKAQNESEALCYIQEALEISRCKKAIVEKFIIGREVGIDFLIKNGAAELLISKERRKIPSTANQPEQIYGCLWPIESESSYRDEFIKIANQIAKAFKLKNTILMIQAFINKTGIFVIEFGARIGGGESFRIIKLKTGFDVLDASISHFTGQDFHSPINDSSEYYAENFIYTRPGVFDKIVYNPDLLSNGTLEYIDTLRARGSVMGGELSSNNRVGVFAVKGSSPIELKEKLNQVLSAIDVLDMDGNSLLNKDIYKLP